MQLNLILKEFTLKNILVHYLSNINLLTYWSKNKEQSQSYENLNNFS